MSDLVLATATYCAAVLASYLAGFWVGRLSTEIKHLRANQVRRHVCDRCHVEEFEGSGDDKG